MATKDVGNLRTRLSWIDDGSTRGLQGFKDDLKGLRSEMNVARSSGLEYTKSLKGLREQSDILSRQFKTQQAQVAELKKRYDESVKTKGEDDKATRKLSDQYNNAVAAMNRTEQQLARVTAEIEKQANPWKVLSKNMDEAGSKMQEFGRGMTDFGKSYSMRVTAPIVASSVAVFKAASDYESAFAGVRKTVDATEEEFKSLSDGIREMAKILPASANDIAAVAEAAGQLGIENENILAFTRTMIDLGEATNLTADQAATEFARFANIVGMSQKDFDRLGSVVVDLGNNLATTEAEIVSMAMRLAGAGAQVGLTEAQIMAFAGALSSVGISADAGGSAFSKVMVNMQLAAELGGEELKEFAKVAGMSANQFKKAFQTDAAGAMIAFIKGLSTAEKRGMSAIAVLDEMGIKEIRMRDALLRAAGASEVFTDAIALGTKAWDENIALTNEAAQRYATTESQLKMLWNRLKDVAITMGDALIPAVMEAINAAEPFFKMIESGAKTFAELDEEQQRTILKVIALTAAIGPASIVAGNLTTAFGGLVKMGGGVAGLLGKAGGAGLIGQFGIMAAVGGPVILTTAAVAGLTYGLYHLSQETEYTIAKTVESIQARREEIESMHDAIEAFETLQRKNKLSTDEILRYLDISTELKNAKTEDAVKALTDEQERLLKQSGLTNDEMQQFLELNDYIIQKAPEAASAISEQGHAYAEVLDKLKELNKMERDLLVSETQVKITEELRKQSSHLSNIEKWTKEVGDLEIKRSEQAEKQNEINGKIGEQNRIMLDIQKEMLNTSGKEKEALFEKWTAEQSIKTELEGQLSYHQSQFDLINKQIDKKRTSISQSQEELELFSSLTDEYAQMVLFEQGIVSEKGKAFEKLKEEQTQLNLNREELERLKSEGVLVGEVYEEHNRSLVEQQRKIDESKKRLHEMNELAGMDIYKNIEIRTSPTIAELDRMLSTSLHRTIDLNINTPRLQSYAAGTDFHPGGRALVGEEGQELAKIGNRWSLLDFGVVDLPRGTQVFTHDESKKILQSLNRMPAYANGARPNGEAAKIVGSLNERTQGGPVYNIEKIIIPAKDIKEFNDVVNIMNRIPQVYNAN